jgi:hypothetical protein
MLTVLLWRNLAGGGEKNWEMIPAIVEMLRSLAVFITLGHLAVQVRHARREVQRSVGQVARKAFANCLESGEQPLVE